LKKRGIELIVPHRAGRVRKATQDGRALRRYRKRWKIERTNAWLGNFRHLVVRYDRKLNIYQAFFQIACFMNRRVYSQITALHEAIRWRARCGGHA
jgi:transposase